jgi:uncharacterized phage protein (predicted DNA packaging)
MLNDVKISLRISHTALDTELLDLIESARHDLALSGVSFEITKDESDPLIKRAIITYCKANFGLENKDSEKYQRSYELLKNHLTLAGDYNV